MRLAIKCTLIALAALIQIGGIAGLALDAHEARRAANEAREIATQAVDQAMIAIDQTAEWKGLADHWEVVAGEAMNACQNRAIRMEGRL